MTAQRVDDLRALTHQHIACPEHHCCGLRHLALDRYETHGRALDGLTDRLGVGSVVLLPLHKWFDVGWRDQPYGMTELAYLAPPIVSASAGFHRDRARRL